MNYVAGLLLLVTKDEENAFWLLKTLIEIILPDYYAPSIPGLITDVRVLSNLITDHLSGYHYNIGGRDTSWEGNSSILLSKSSGGTKNRKCCFSVVKNETLIY